jgi:hypothetical protein
MISIKPYNMKAIIYMLLFLVCSQALIAQKRVIPDSGKSDASLTTTHKPWDDPKLTEDQRLQMMKAENPNPVKIDQPLALDSKENLPAEGNAPVIWKAKPLPELEDRTTISGKEASVPSQIIRTAQDQPAGVKPEKLTNYRSINGLQEQPAGIKSQQVTDYRSMKGENKQPKGNPSGK